MQIKLEFDTETEDLTVYFDNEPWERQMFVKGSNTSAAFIKAEISLVELFNNLIQNDE